MSSLHRGTRGNGAGLEHTPQQQAAMILGVVFLLVGIAGFIPGITTHYGDMKFAGHNSMAMLLGTFCVSVLHNLIHLAFGVAGVAMARTHPKARTYLLVGGIVYAVVLIYGLIIDYDSAVNFVPLNTADNWLHLILAVAMIALAFVPATRQRTVDPTVPG